MTIELNHLLLFAIIIICLIILVLIFLRTQSGANLEDEFSIIKKQIQNEMRSNREELQNTLQHNRRDVGVNIHNLQEKLDSQVSNLLNLIRQNDKLNRDELYQQLDKFKVSFSNDVKSFNDLQKEKFAAMEEKQSQLITHTNEKLEAMRQTVDEKLHKTLEERLGQSFKLVSDRLEAVQLGLGEMKQLANGVGDLKKVLSNVKSRGVFGEIQLGNLLDQIMAPEQYDSNVKTKKGSNDLVEFAIKLPGRDENHQFIYLPIDAKFPQEDFIRIQEASELGDLEALELAKKAFYKSIKKFGKDIHQKYIDPPHTTDFGIMFLPTEGLFAEVVKQPELLEFLQRDLKIIVTGPTTLAALLNSLQMGFRTLAIQKRSSEVWEILGAVKTEFGKFSNILTKAQKKINEANAEIDNLVGTRTRMMMSKLKKVEELPTSETTNPFLKEKEVQNPLELIDGINPKDDN